MRCHDPSGGSRLTCRTWAGMWAGRAGTGLWASWHRRFAEKLPGRLGSARRVRRGGFGEVGGEPTPGFRQMVHINKIHQGGGRLGSTQFVFILLEGLCTNGSDPCSFGVVVSGIWFNLYG